MKIVSKIVELVVDGSKAELEKKLNSLKEKYRIIFSDIFYNDDDDMRCYTMQVKYLEKGIC